MTEEQEQRAAEIRKGWSTSVEEKRRVVRQKTPLPFGWRSGWVWIAAGAYFRTRSGDALDKSKRLERQVDKALTDDGQKVLFQ